MKNPSLAFLALPLVVAGCASNPTPPAAEAKATVKQEGADSLKGDVQTGSRLSRLGTDRVVRSLGNQTFRDETEVRSLGNEIGARSN